MPRKTTLVMKRLQLFRSLILVVCTALLTLSSAGQSLTLSQDSIAPIENFTPSTAPTVLDTTIVVLELCLTALEYAKDQTRVLRKTENLLETYQILYFSKKEEFEIEVAKRKEAEKIAAHYRKEYMTLASTPELTASFPSLRPWPIIGGLVGGFIVGVLVMK